MKSVWQVVTLLWSVLCRSALIEVWHQTSVFFYQQTAFIDDSAPAELQHARTLSNGRPQQQETKHDQHKFWRYLSPLRTYFAWLQNSAGTGLLSCSFGFTGRDLWCAYFILEKPKVPGIGSLLASGKRLRLAGFNALKVCTLWPQDAKKLFIAALKLLPFAVRIETVYCEQGTKSTASGPLATQFFWPCVKKVLAWPLVECLQTKLAQPLSCCLDYWTLTRVFDSWFSSCQQSALCCLRYSTEGLARRKTRPLQYAGLYVYWDGRCGRLSDVGSYAFKQCMSVTDHLSNCSRGALAWVSDIPQRGNSQHWRWATAGHVKAAKIVRCTSTWSYLWLFTIVTMSEVMRNVRSSILRFLNSE